MTDPLELIQRWLDGFDARDLAQMLAVAHPEIVLRPMRWVPRSQYDGHAGVRAWLEDVEASGVSATVAVDSIRLLADGRIIVEGTLSDAPMRFVALYAIRDERIAHVQAYISEREVLEQLGVISSVDQPGARGARAGVPRPRSPAG